VLLAVRINVENVRVGQSWVVPMEKLPDVSGDKSAVHAMRASTLPAAATGAGLIAARPWRIW
jgi:hypothetical protein